MLMTGLWQAMKFLPRLFLLDFALGVVATILFWFWLFGIPTSQNHLGMMIAHGGIYVYQLSCFFAVLILFFRPGIGLAVVLAPIPWLWLLTLLTSASHSLFGPLRFA
jgi:hypothetical protein